MHFRFCIAGGSRPAGLRWLPASQCCLPSSTCAAVDDALSGSRGGKVSASGLLNVVVCCSVHAVQARGRPGGSAGLPTGAAGGRPGLCPPAPQLTTRWVAIEKWRRCWRHCHTHTATYSGDLFNVRRAGHEPASPPAAARSWPLVPQLVRSRSLAPVFKTVATLPRRTLPLQEHPLLRPPSCRYPAARLASSCTCSSEQAAPLLMSVASSGSTLLQCWQAHRGGSQWAQQCLRRRCVVRPCRPTPLPSP